MSDAVLVRLEGSPAPRCAPTGPPSAIGNSLKEVWSLDRASILFSWTDLPAATAYKLRSDLVKWGPFAASAGSAPSGSPPLALPAPPEPLVFYRIAGANCLGEGPR